MSAEQTQTVSVQREYIAAPLGTVRGEGGWTGQIYPVSDETRDGLVISRVLIRPDDGATALVVPHDMLRSEGEDRFALPLSRSAANAYLAGVADIDEAAVLAGERIVVPVVEETFTVGKQWVETGGVRIVKTVSTHEETVQQPLLREHVVVDRVSINRIVEAAPAQREEDGVLIIPVVEEVLVIGKRLLLKEELRISRTREEVLEQQIVTLRREEARVEPLAVQTAEG